MFDSTDTSARFARGDKLSLKGTGEIGVVTDVTHIAAEWHYELFMTTGASTRYAERFLTANVEDDSIVGKLRTWDFLEPAEFRQAVTTLKLRRPLEQNLYSYLASRTDLQPYQFKPVLKLLNSPYGRMFIADEVGLGKTIEAGIIMLELAARFPLRRVLVVCPPALRRKWQAELFERFDQEFEILDTRRAVAIVADSDFSHDSVKAIASMSLLRGGAFVEALSESETRFDLVVVDESHHMQNPETASHRLGEHLSAVADHMLMLSATPVSLSTSNLFHQLSILVPEEFFDAAEFSDRIAPNQHLHQAIRALRNPPDVEAALAELHKITALPQGQLFLGNPFYREACETLESVNGGPLSLEQRFQLQQKISDLSTIGHVFTRTRKREVQDHFPARRAVVIKVRLTDAERAYYDAVTEFVRSQAGQIANLIVVMPQRQVASSIPAAREYMQKRWGMTDEIEDDTAAELEFDVDEGAEIPVIDGEAYGSLVDTWRAAEGIDSKFDQFLIAITEAIEGGTAKDGKILVFSFFRKTIEHLARRLEGATLGGQPLRVSVLYGPTAEEERHRIVAAFRNEPGPHVVLASEIAAEGLDFEFANVMVNYDLPWNPMRVEQRIGRLDRYGQRSEVIHIINFAVEDTIEERILERLFTRIGIFEASIGDLESILGDEIETLTRELLRPGVTVEEEADIIDQVAENIVRRKSEMESFEKESQSLLGQDDVFTQQLQRIEHDQRYVGPDEIRNFVTVALKAEYPRIKIKGGDGRTTAITVPTDGSLRDLLATYLQRRPDRSGRKAWRAVERARPGTDWTVTFDSEVATEQRELDFVTLQHPLVGALLDAQPEVVRPTVALHVESDDLAPGSYLFFLYLLNVKSFRSGLEFSSVVVRPGHGVDETLSRQLLALIANGSPIGAAMRPDDDAVDSAAALADEWIAAHIGERETELTLVNDQILDRRAASLQDSFDRWLTHRRQLLAEAEYRGQASIARLHQGYIRRRESELVDKLRQIEEQRAVLIGQELVAGGVLEIERVGR